MPAKFVHGLRGCCVAVALVLATAHAAEPKDAPSPVGLTRDQVIAKYGEPKSQIAAGNRTVMFFAKERFILRDGVVVDVERIAEPVTRRPAPTPVAPPAVVPITTEAAPAGATPVVPAQPAPTPAPRVVPVQPQPVAPAPSAPVVAPTQPPPADAPDAGTEAKLEIKSVRPASGTYQRSATKQETSTASTAGARPPTISPTPAAPTSAAPAPTASAPATPVVPETKPAPGPVAVASGTTSAAAPAAAAPSSSSAAPTAPAPAGETADAAKPDEAPKEEDAIAAAKAEKEKKLKIARARRRLADAAEPDQPTLGEAFLTGRTLFIGLIAIAGGIGYLVWRSRQRQLLLAATAVSQTPFESPAASLAVGDSAFTPELLAKLEWKRFEELVAAYYVKTGVVAVRTKNGPANPVHIKISWKGESRPFAYVRCIPHPTGLVDAAPLQELGAALAAEDIRRGYVVTTGKFNVNARDYAEDKHLTLLTGDIFLEKLNALPEAARAEIVQAVTNGDYQTPSCPKCEARMARSGDDPSIWRCPNHADQVIPAWH